MYTSTTRSITVSVEPTYLESESVPDKHLYVWAYRVSIMNAGEDVVQLKTRHWTITDGFGRVQEVQGPGVVGEQPVLGPGDTFEYTSGTPLPTPSGIMRGTYAMADGDGGLFDVEIPAFSLDSPGQSRQVN
jgi:ApaG protein